jgi:hypothetical protein
VFCLEDNPSSLWFELRLKAVSDLCGQALLQLQVTGDLLHHARELRQSDDPLGGQIGDVGNAIERQEVMQAVAAAQEDRRMSGSARRGRAAQLEDASCLRGVVGHKPFERGPWRKYIEQPTRNPLMQRADSRLVLAHDVAIGTVA